MAKFILILFSFFLGSGAFASDLQGFLKNCAYGTLGGAAAGLVTVVASDRPNEQTSHIAQGASLGLYGGIAYGLYKLNEEPERVKMDPYASLEPLFKDRQVKGAQLLFHFASF